MQPPPGTTVNTGRVSKSPLRAKSSQKVAVSSYNKAFKKAFESLSTLKMM
jgi:hypothetical protein